MIDLHNHLLPGVDDGAADLREAGAALAAFRAQGVHTVVTTPHLDASLAGDPRRLAARLREVDAAWVRLLESASAPPELRLERGAELRLDTPEPDADDPRVRLAGTRFTLVEFPSMAVPPNAERPIHHMVRRGWTPVIAHPERYSNLDPALRDVERWRVTGALLQVNAGSLLGRSAGPHAGRPGSSWSAAGRTTWRATTTRAGGSRLPARGPSRWHPSPPLPPPGGGSSGHGEPRWFACGLLTTPAGRPVQLLPYTAPIYGTCGSATFSHLADEIKAGTRFPEPTMRAGFLDWRHRTEPGRAVRHRRVRCSSRRLLACPSSWSAPPGSAPRPAPHSLRPPIS